MSEYSAKKHYENFLSKYYSWMFGDFKQEVHKNRDWFDRHKIHPSLNKRAIDFGCGSGFQSLALSSIGFKVTALDFDSHLLEELKSHDPEREIDIVQGDILNPENYSDIGYFELAVCMGDTLTHLPTIDSISDFFLSVYDILQPGGCFILSFRDYTVELTGLDRIIPVQNDGNKIMTVFLEYHAENLLVNDLIYERKTDGWELQKSVYKKVRISPDNVINQLKSAKFSVEYVQKEHGLVYMIQKRWPHEFSRNES